MPDAVGAGERHGAGGVPVEHGVEVVLADGLEHWRVQAGGGEEGDGRGDVAELLHEHAQVHGRADAEPDEVGDRAPERVGRAEVVHVRAEQRRRAPVGEQLTGGVAQQQLVVGQGEVHGRPFVRCELTCGRRATGRRRS